MYRMAGKEEFSSEMRAPALEKGGGRGENEKGIVTARRMKRMKPSSSRFPIPIY